MNHKDPRLNDAAWLAENAMRNCAGGSFRHTRVPGVTWAKDYPGQVTDGRMGRPVVSMVPLSWLPGELQDEVKKILDAGQ